jgi:Zn-dependent protease with chaperone function
MIGDVSTASSVAVALATILVDMKYSRGFESEVQTRFFDSHPAVQERIQQLRD